MNCKCTGFFGPTGSGKTTKLKQIAHEHYNKTKISFCFQENILLEQLTVEKNIRIPLENQYTQEEIKEKIDYWLYKLDIKNKSGSICKNLSSGEKQRVNLARAFAYNGNIILLDEPFSSQDSIHKEQIIEIIKELKKEKEIYLVSHERKDLEILCDEILNFPQEIQE